jgi:lipoprotein-anchoring transpeptidase ErfK/SrfK
LHSRFQILLNHLVSLSEGPELVRDLAMKKLFKILMAAAVGLTMAALPAEASTKRKRNRAPVAPVLQVHIDISSQSMSVRANGWSYGNWRVSTARSGYYTPRGSYSVKRLAKMHYSRKYDNSPMPNSVFFHGGYAIHGTGSIRSLGRPASHGCVRLHPSNAAALYSLVQKYGARRTRITLSN